MAIRTLNERSTSYGLFVALLWDDETNETFIEMTTEDDFNRFEIVPGDENFAFTHPFVYQTNAVHVDADGTRFHAPDFECARVGTLHPEYETS